MNIFEAIIFLGLVAVIVFASRWAGGLFGISGWFIAAPLILGAFCALRWLGRRLAGRRADPWPFERGSNRDD
jgi:hypothetical protein